MTRVESPIGRIALLASVDGITRVHLGDDEIDRAIDRSDRNGARHERAAAKALDRYFAGECAAIDEVALDFDRMTPLRRRIYEALRAIPAGEITTYSALAAAAGRPGAARAAGSAMAENRLPIFIPCHRVLHAGAPAPRAWIAAGKSAEEMPVGSFSSEISIKRALLEIEARSALAGSSKKH